MGSLVFLPPVAVVPFTGVPSVLFPELYPALLFTVEFLAFTVVLFESLLKLCDAGLV